MHTIVMDCQSSIILPLPHQKVGPPNSKISLPANKLGARRMTQTRQQPALTHNLQLSLFSLEYWFSDQQILSFV